MLTEAKVLALLQVVVPADTPLTVPAEVRILEILGIVSNQEAVNVLKLAAVMVPPTTPATLKGLVQLLTGLMKMNPAATREHHSAIADILTNLDKTADTNLTYSTFLPICETLMNDNPNKRVIPATKSSAK